MIKTFLSLIILNYSLATFLQETVLSFNNDLKTSSSDIKDVIPAVNTETNEIAFFAADAKNVYGYKVDANFKVIAKITSEEKSRKHKVVIGSIASKNDSYRIFLTDKNQNNFAFVNFSFKDGATSLKEFSIGEDEEFIQTVNSKNQFYLISGSKLENHLYLYSFDEYGTPLKNDIDISALRFIDYKGKKTNILSFLITGNDLKKFEENTPNSIELTSEETKMFVRENSIFFTLDDHKMFTQVLEIDLDTYKADSFQFNKPALGEKQKEQILI